MIIGHTIRFNFAKAFTGCAAFLLINVAGLFCVFAQEETLTIATYYPSPLGVYQTLRFFPHDDFVPADACADRGALYYDNTSNQLYVCQGAAGSAVWTAPTGGASFWTQPGGTMVLYTTNVNWNVGVGTTAPTSKLHVAGGDLTVQNGSGITLGGVRRTTWPAPSDCVWLVTNTSYHTRDAGTHPTMGNFWGYQKRYCTAARPFLRGFRLLSDEEIAEDEVTHIYCCGN